MTEAHGCEQLAQSCYPIAPRPGIDLTTSEFSRCGDTIQYTNLKHFNWQLELPSLLRLYRFMSVSLSVDTVVILMPGFINTDYSQIISYLVIRQQSLFINLKSQFIL